MDTKTVAVDVNRGDYVDIEARDDDDSELAIYVSYISRQFDTESY